MQQLCCCYLRIYGQTDRLTDMVKLRLATSKLLENRLSNNSRWRQLFYFHCVPPSKSFQWFTVMRHDGRRRDAIFLIHTMWLFYFVQETHNSMIITQCYLRLNVKDLSKFNRKGFLTYALLVFDCSICHNINICS